MRSLANAAAVLVGAIAYVTPYVTLEGVWWRFIPSTLLILGTGALVLGKDAGRFFGLVMSKWGFCSSVALLVLLLPLSYWVLDELVVTGSLTLHRDAGTRSQVHQLFQVFDDEIVLRAALLTMVLRAFPHPKAAIIALAFAFAAGHRAVYGVGGEEIGTSALITLFCLGVITNTLFVQFRHIGYGFALHFAWNFWRFNTSYYLDGRFLSEGQTFNYVEGNMWIVGGSVLAMVLVFGTYVSRTRQSSLEPSA